MAKGLNKKVLFFIDEYGTAAAGSLYLGAVVVFARDAGHFDKLFSDLLEPTVHEIHASALNDGYLQGLMQRFWKGTSTSNRPVMINRKLNVTGASGGVLYAEAVVETVKIGLKRFRADVLKRENISNVDVIIDANHHNTHAEFSAEIARAQREEGVFKAVSRVSAIDSAASRMLQLADVVAHSRKWISNGELNAPGLRERFGIQIMA